MPLKMTLRDLAEDARRHINEIDYDELAVMTLGTAGPPPVVIDVREPDEAARGIIPGSVNIPRGVLERDIEKAVFGGVVSDDQLARPIVCYCAGGSRSLLAADALRRMGFTNAMSLAGGFGAWAEAGKPVEVRR